MHHSLLRFVFLLSLASPALAASESATPYLRSELAVEGSRALARVSMAPGSYAYRGKIALFADGARLTPLQIPKGKIKSDPSFGEVEVLEGSFIFSAAIPVGAATIQSVDQACSETMGICFSPRAMELNLRSGATRELSMREADALARLIPPTPGKSAPSASSAPKGRHGSR